MICPCWFGFWYLRLRGHIHVGLIVFPKCLREKFNTKFSLLDIYIKHNLVFAVGTEILDRFFKFHMEFENKPHMGKRSDFGAIFWGIFFL